MNTADKMIKSSNVFKKVSNLTLAVCLGMVLFSLCVFLMADKIVANNQIEVVKKVENISK